MEWKKVGCLTAICLLAFHCRVFSVLRYESVIHEFDPYFNYRTTKYLRDKGFYEFWNWFDESAWYPLGRVVGQTLFPGLMVTANFMWQVATRVGIMLDIREICVFTAPLFSMGTAWATYKLTQTATESTSAGLIAALIIAVCPSYLSRSTAGGFDNEAIAIFTLVLSFYTFLRAAKKGTLGSVVVASLAYFYMVTVWGGYVFITNCIAGYVLSVLAMNRMDHNLWLAYCGWYVLGSMWCFNIPFVGLATVNSAEHLSSHVAFAVLVAWYFRQELAHLARRTSTRLNLLVFATFLLTAGGAAFIVSRGWSKFSGRSMTLLDPSYATKNVPIIASISEHQPTIWSVFHSEIGSSFVMVPAGIFLSLSTPQNKYAWFLGVYGVLAAYFSAVMIRLTLVLAPAAAALAGYALSEALRAGLHAIKVADRQAVADLESKTELPSETRLDSKKKGKQQSRGEPKATKTVGQPVHRHMEDILKGRKYIALGVLLFVGVLLYRVVTLGVFSAAALYSNPSIVTSARLRNGATLIIDDLREAFQWMSQNTHPEAKVMSWWDYGYQAAYMANRSVIVDNNTWNTTHIATVGKALSNDQETAYRITQSLDVDYVFVLFGGVTRYSGDDLNKFVWIIRISSAEFPDECPTEEEFISPATGGLDVGEYGATKLKKSLMYLLSYHNFHNNVLTQGHDVVRNQAIPRTEPLKYFEEIYSTTSWMVRIYRVQKGIQR